VPTPSWVTVPVAGEIDLASAPVTEMCVNERPWSEAKGAQGVASTSP
jgi:hypothetical protein